MREDGRGGRCSERNGASVERRKEKVARMVGKVGSNRKSTETKRKYSERMVGERCCPI